MKKKGLIFGGIGIFLILVGIILYFVLDLTKSKKEDQEQEALIIEKYALFRSSVEKFSSERVKVFDSVLNNLFIEDVKMEHKNWNKVLLSYKLVVDMIEQNSTELKKLCISKFYNDKDANNKCEAFVISYETSINYFVKDIELYNFFLETYQQNQEVEDKVKVEIFNMKPYNYIDLNDDGKYLGKES